MDVAEALASRFTCRAFRDTPVSRQTVEAILAAASRAPSGGNLQPWRVWAVSGADLAALQDAIKARIAAGALSDGQTEYNIYPPDMGPPFSDRKFAAGAAMYAALGVDHADMAGQMAQYVANFELFGAPVGLIFAIDRSLQQGQWADLGLYLQSVMLLAREHGLHTAALESWALWHATIRQVLEIPGELMIFCAMALGHADGGAAINGFRTGRAPLAEFAVLRGF